MSQPRAFLRLAASATFAALLGAGVLGASAVPAFARQSLGLSAASFQFATAAGQSGHGELFVSNMGDEPIKVLVYSADQKVDGRGVATYVVPNRDTQDFLNSPAAWVRLDLPTSAKAVGNTPYLELSPGERVPVRFVVQTPSAALSGDHQILVFFEIFDFQKGSKGVVSQVSGRLGARIRVRIKGEIDERLDVQPFSVPQIVLNGVLPYAFTVRNGGNVDKSVSARVSLLDRNESEQIDSNAMTDTPVYADTAREQSGTVSVAGLTPGAYTARLIATYTKENRAAQSGVITKDRQVWVIPLWMVIAAGTVVLLLALWLLWRVALAVSRRRVHRGLDLAHAEEDAMDAVEE
jgi:hypothetical protein